MEQFFQQVASGLANGAIYALLALALVMIFVSTNHINFAQGEMAMVSMPFDLMSAAMPSRQGIVEISLRDGRQLERHTKAVRGSAENPMTRKDVDEKCCDLIAPVLGGNRARKLCDAVWGLEKVRDVRTLRQLLRT